MNFQLLLIIISTSNRTRDFLAIRLYNNANVQRTCTYASSEIHNGDIRKIAPVNENTKTREQARASRTRKVTTMKKVKKESVLRARRRKISEFARTRVSAFYNIPHFLFEMYKRNTSRSRGRVRLCISSQNSTRRIFVLPIRPNPLKTNERFYKKYNIRRKWICRYVYVCAWYFNLWSFAREKFKQKITECRSNNGELSVARYMSNEQ